MELAVRLENITLSYGSKDILANVQLSAYQNDRIGIIGGNGQGKTTLLKLIGGKIQPDQGKIQKETTFNYFSQMAEVDDLKRVDSLDWALMRQLKVPKNRKETLSGGEAAKFRLVQALSTYQAGLLLDEPTTHLDFNSVQRLVEELRYYYGTLLFVSHDRYFLNQLVTKIWEVKDGKVREFIGNYDDYKRQIEAETLENERKVAIYGKEKRRLEQAIEKKKEQAEKIIQVSGKKKRQNIRPDRLSSTKQKDTIQKAVQKTVKSIEKRLSQLTEVSDSKVEMNICFPKPRSVEIHNKFPIRGENIFLRKGKKVLLENVHFQFSLMKKIAIVGENGVGKSSLLQHILARGEGMFISPKVVFSTYQQIDYKLTSEETTLSYLMKRTEYSEQVVRSILHNLGCSQMEVWKPVQVLSGGEATRLAIALLFVKPSNVLILDEPTNFIDLPTTEALETLIRMYPGTVIFTSHDPYFVRQTADEVYRLKERKLILTEKV